MAETSKKREWVKNAAIVFLSIMLVLTFFSNTIMNRSLPEVTTQYVTSGSINEMIRGSGTVTANQNYEVTLDDKQLGRKVDAVYVRIGDEVKTGDLLFTLEGIENDDGYYTAKDNLARAQIEYEQKLLELSKDRYAAENAAVESARDALSKARSENRDIEYAQENIASAKKTQKVEEKQKTFDDLKKHLEILSEQKDEEIAHLKELKKDAEDRRDAISDTTSAEYLEWDNAAKEYQAQLDNNPTAKEYEEIYEKYRTAKNELDAANAAVEKAEATYGDAASQPLLDLDYLEDDYDNAVAALKDAMASEKIDDKIDSLELEIAARAVEQAQKELEDYTAGGGSNEVLAKTSGMISELNIIAGKEASMPTAAVIQQSDRGYSLSFPVTAEQAKKLSVGASAEITNYWWGSDLKATLESIRPDPASAGRSRLLTFTITGSVSEGETLNLSIGQRGQNYDALVPNAAVRNDSNGTFVLLMTTKNSPLGNRYAATRVDVKVLASDDNMSAVSGLGYGDYVITTSSKPVEPGDLVRIAEG